MATAHHAVVPAAVVVNPLLLDLELARRAATLLTSHLPEKTREQITVDVLGRLETEKLARELKGLNHWTEHAPKALDSILKKIRLEAAARREVLTVFYKVNHGGALAFACAALRDQDEAEDAVSQTYVELLGGKTTPGHFFRALKNNILDRQRNRGRELEKFVPAGEVFEPGLAQGDEFEENEVSFEPPSTRFEDQDPLDILIAREDQEENRRLIEKAKQIAQQERKFCWIGQKQWGQELGISTARVRRC